MTQEKIKDDPFDLLVTEAEKLGAVACLVAEAADQEEKAHWINIGHVIEDFADRIRGYAHKILDDEEARKKGQAAPKGGASQ